MAMGLSPALLYYAAVVGRVRIILQCQSLRPFAEDQPNVIGQASRLFDLGSAQDPLSDHSPESIFD